MIVQIKQEVKKFLEITFLINFNSLADDVNLFQTGIIDSFGFVELINFLEKKFAIKISDAELNSDALISLTNITNYLNNKLRTSTL